MPRGIGASVLDIKDPSQPPSKRQLTVGEERFRAQWWGFPYHVVETVEEALRIVTTAGP